MADINIVQAHDLAPEQARAAAQQVADKLAEQFELECVWDGDVLRFERSGVSGSLSLLPDQARLHVALGFLFSAFSPQIEAKVADKMRRVFSAA
ncbi:polyhydroxyalkanoic acid system protein [Rugamonas sp. FT82W]|uniref:Polyhydroxyalkanoic acid system protein n=1 Tax=Duganella vulcania TaxID=2692166 RepID=A0A845G7Z6_9BURK|nr:polyhydroxyalkanoic acid system family protein [Duganella vulcania]MYM88888.1 polyhydroxyalkanoic acid system protein [Duganella vulcania]